VVRLSSVLANLCQVDTKYFNPKSGSIKLLIHTKNTNRVISFQSQKWFD